MQIFTTFHNEKITARLREAFPDIEFTEDDITDSDLLILAAKTSQFGIDPKKIREYLDVEIPAMVIASDNYAAGRDLIEFARGKIPEENILVPVNKVISLQAIINVINNSMLGEYKIDFDSEDISPIATLEQVNETVIHDFPVTQRIIAPLENVRDLPKDFIAVYGIKGGVGASTVVAMMVGAMRDAVHVEVVGPGYIPSAWSYYGKSAKASGNYVCWDCLEGFPEIHGLPVLDISSTVPLSMLDEIIAKAACLILVADRSEISFHMVSDLFRGGFTCDMLVVNSTFMGIGNTVDTYKGEYGDVMPDDMIDIPGGLDVESIVLKAQRDHVSPVSIAGAEDLTMATGEIVSAIRKKISM